MIITGIIMGIMTFTAMIILVEKLPKRLKMLVYGHHLLSDLLFTGFCFTLFPLTGTATLINAAVFCLLFSSYLAIRRQIKPWIRVKLGGPTLFRIERNHQKQSKEGIIGRIEK